MSNYICSECGRDCGSAMALGKHEKVCLPRERFTNRFSESDRCPKCSRLGRSFFVREDDLLVCLDCGTVFMSEADMADLRNELKGKSWRRPNT